MAGKTLGAQASMHILFAFRTIFMSTSNRILPEYADKKIRQEIEEIRTRINEIALYCTILNAELTEPTIC